MCGVVTRSFLAPEYREASAIVNQFFMIDPPTRARMLAGGKRLWVRALQHVDHEADALSSGWRGCRRCADIDEREVIASRRGRAIERDRLVNGSACSCYDSSGRVNRTVSEPHSEGRNGDRARLACSGSTRHSVRCRAERLL